MKKFLSMILLLGSIVSAQEPIIRLKQIGTYKTPSTWWRQSVTHQLQTYLADDINNAAFANNNFDAWRDSVMQIEVTLDDNGANISTFRLDIVFDNDLIDWSHEDTEVIKGAHLLTGTEGDSTLGADYSYEVVHYSNVGYIDSLQSANNEKSQGDNSNYDWLRITAVSHNVNEFEFGGGNGVQKQIVKLNFKIEDKVDDYAPRSFRVATFYEGNQGYYTYVSDDYALDYKVYIDGNWGNATVNDRTYDGGARGDITLHPELVNIEGYFRYIQGNDRGAENTYPYWKIRFELDQSNPQDNNSWYNIETVGDVTSLTDETTTDDIIGDDNGTYYYDNQGTTADQALPSEGFLGVSYYDTTYTDDRGYYNIMLPRNNVYRMSFYPPDSLDDIEDHTQYEMDRYQITNLNDAIASFNFQSNKWKSVVGVDTLTAAEYLVADVDGDDLFQLNDSYFIWAYTSQILPKYLHLNGDSLQNWSTIDTLKENGNWLNYQWYEEWGKQKYEFTVFWDDSLVEDTTLEFGAIEVINPLMNDVQTGLDTLQISIGGGSSVYGNDVNPDYTIDSIKYYFTGDVNTTGTKVKEPGDNADGYIDVNGSTFYRWGDGNAPGTWLNRIMVEESDVDFTLPQDSTVRVRSGDIIEVPLRINPKGLNVAGLEFEIRFKSDELEFIDMNTGKLPGPWFTYVNVHKETDEGWRKVSFGGMDYSPGNAPQNYWIDEEQVALKLLFRADFPATEWTQAPIEFVGKYSAGDPSGRDLTVYRESGQVLVWNKYWAFGGGEPEEDEITYNYPNPFSETTRFQFYVDELKEVKLYILNSNGQYVGKLLDEMVAPGIHTFDFSNVPSVWLPEQSVYQKHKKLEPGVYIFILQTGNKIKANKFTVTG